MPNLSYKEISYIIYWKCNIIIIIFWNTNNKKVWKGVIKQIVNFKPQTSTKQIKLRLDDCEITDSAEVASAFNEYFSSIGNDLARTIPSVDKKP